MANVDDELAEALRESEQAAQAEPAAVAVPVPGAPPAKPKRSVGLLVGLIVMGGAVLTLIFMTFNPTYSRKVDQVTSDKQKLAGRNLRVEGTLKRCSLTRRDEPCEFRFTMMSGGKELPVHYARCTVPDTFKDVPGMVVDVTVEGTLDPNGHLEANNIMAKCPSKYEMQERAKRGEQAPHLDPFANKPCM